MTYLTPAPRGFLGRPLIALLFAIATGVMGYHLSAWLHLNSWIVFIIIAAVVSVVHFVWYQVEKPK